MTTPIPVIAGLTGLGLIASVVFFTNQAKAPLNAENSLVTPALHSSTPAANHTSADLSTLSLPSFANQTFSGTNFTIGQNLAQNDSYVRHYITYQSGDLTISGILNIPRGQGPFPLLVLNHGYIDPAVYTNGRGLKREQDYLARRGYAVLHSDYRNHAASDSDPQNEHNFRLGYAEDVINGIHAIKAANLPQIDTDRIGMLGHSMGGGIAWVIAVTQPDLVDAYVLFAPISADTRDNFNKWTRSRPQVASAILDAHGTPQTNPSFWDNISPQTFFSNIANPILIHHGTTDESVPIQWSQHATEQLQSAQKDVTLHIYPNEPHEFIHAWPTVMQRTVDFFNTHL